MERESYIEKNKKHHRMLNIYGAPILAIISTIWFVLIFISNVENTGYIYVTLIFVALISWWWFFYKLPRKLGLCCKNCKCILSIGRNEAYVHDYGACPKCGEKLWN